MSGHSSSQEMCKYSYERYFNPTKMAQMELYVIQRIDIFTNVSVETLNYQNIRIYFLFLFWLVTLQIQHF